MNTTEKIRWSYRLDTERIPVEILPGMFGEAIYPRMVIYLYGTDSLDEALSIRGIPQINDDLSGKPITRRIAEHVEDLGWEITFYTSPEQIA